MSGGGLAAAARVAATGEWEDETGSRLPAGEVHAWLPGTNQTICDVPLHRAGLRRFPHVPWADAMPETGGSADEVVRVCPRCAAAAGRGRGRRWTRDSPRP